MKKTALWIVAGTLFAAAALFVYSSVRAYEIIPDQRQLEGTGCMTAYEGYQHNQTYQPTLDILTSVEVKMRNRQGGANIILRIKDEVTGAIVVDVNQRMDEGDGWETFDLVGDALGYFLDTDHPHSIWIGTSYFSGEDAPCWVYTGTDNYEFGVRRQGMTEKSGDFTFATMGYDIDMGRDNPEPPPEEPGDDGDATPPEDDATPPEDSGTQDSQDGDNTGSSVVPDQSKSAAEEVVAEGESVSPPELGLVLVNNEVISLEDSSEVPVEDGDVVKVTGTADAGDTVVVVIGDLAYTAVADEDGNWYVVFDASEMEDGSYAVEGQAKDGEEGSTKVELFTLVKGEAEVMTPVSYGIAGTTEEDTLWDRVWGGELCWVVYVVVALLLTVLVFGAFFLYKKKKKGDKSGKDPMSPKVPPAQSGPAVES